MNTPEFRFSEVDCDSGKSLCSGLSWLSTSSSAEAAPLGRVWGVNERVERFSGYKAVLIF